MIQKSEKMARKRTNKSEPQRIPEGGREYLKLREENIQKITKKMEDIGWQHGRVQSVHRKEKKMIVAAHWTTQC